jgi:hypothetical protein
VKYFCDALNRLLEDLTPGIPQIVMGDFNVVLLSKKDDVITCTFSAFEQNIKSSTTRKLTFLDHIYTRHLNAQQAGVVPIYYSYHHMTYTLQGLQVLFNIVMAKFPIPENCSAYVPMILKEFCFSKINGLQLPSYDIYFCRYATTSVESFDKYIQILLILSRHCYLQTL